MVDPAVETDLSEVLQRFRDAKAALDASSQHERSCVAIATARQKALEEGQRAIEEQAVIVKGIEDDLLAAAEDKKHPFRNLLEQAKNHRTALKEKKDDLENELTSANDKRASAKEDHTYKNSEYQAAKAALLDVVLVPLRNVQRAWSLKEARAKFNVIAFSETVDADKKRLAVQIDSTEIKAATEDLLAFLTARQIAEQMDESSYMRQLRNKVDRLAERCAVAANAIEHAVGKDQADSWYRCRHADIAGAVTAVGQAIELVRSDLSEASLSELEQEAKRLTREAARHLYSIIRPVRQIGNRIRGLSADLRNSEKLENGYAEVRSIAHDLEEGIGLTWWPLGIAGGAALLAGIIIQHPSSFIPASFAQEALALVFGTTYVATRYSANASRDHRMKFIQSSVIDLIAERLKMSCEDGVECKFAAKTAAEWKIVETPTDPTDSSKKRKRSKSLLQTVKEGAWFVYPAGITAALLMFAIAPAFTAPFGAATREVTMLIGETQFGDRCTIAEGLYVDYEDDQHILAAEEPRALRSWVFPRAFGQRFSADTVVAVQPASAVTGLARCVGSPPPDPLTSIVVEAPVINLPEWRTAAMPDCRPPYLCDTSPGVLDEIKEINGLLQAAKRQFEDHLTQQPNPPDVSVTFLTEADTVVGPLFPHLFTHIVVPEGEPPLQLENNQFLVFAPGRVEDVDNRMDLAFKKGIESIPADLDEGLNSAQNYQLLELLQRTEAILVKEVEFHLRVTGFASDEWENLPVGDDLAKSLNHALAEGRRAGVLRFLANALGKDKAEKLMVRAADGPCVPLSTWSTVPAWEDYKLRRFDDHPDMTSFRVAELESLLDKTNSEILRRQLQRVVRVDFNSVTACEV